MFARAALVGRVARERAEARRKVLLTNQPAKEKAPVAPLRQRCFIPCMRGPWVTVGFGIFLIITGAIMCNFAFHAHHYALSDSPHASNTTELNKPIYNGLRSLTYIGPAFMGFGAFTIIIACVLLFDKRDKILKEYIKAQVQSQQDMSMELSIRVVTPGPPNLSPQHSSASSTPSHKLLGSTTSSAASDNLLTPT